MVKDAAAVKRGRNSKQRGASIERKVAALVGGQRIGNRGTSSADVTTDEYAIEVKSTVGPTPVWLQRAWAQALKAAAETGLVPVVIRSHVDGGRRTYWRIEKMEVEGGN